MRPSKALEKQRGGAQVRTTPALSSKYRKTPSVRFHGLDWRTMTAGWTFFRSSGLPFLTVALKRSRPGLATETHGVARGAAAERAGRWRRRSARRGKRT